MNEGFLRRLKEHRQTLWLLCRWKAPDGVDLGIYRSDERLQVDVILMHQGENVKALNVKFSDQQECNAHMDFMADVVREQAGEAYRDKRVVLPADDTPVIDGDLIRFGVRFQDFVDSIACRGIGGKG